MKQRSICILCFLYFHFTSFGQIAKRNTIFDGGVNVVANDLNISDRVELRSLAFPSFLHFFSDVFALGGQLIVGGTPDDGGITGMTLSSRYYFGVLDKEALFLTGDIGFERFNATTTWSGNVGLGYDYFLTRSIALETVLSFGFVRPKNIFFMTDPRQLQMNLGTGIKIFFDRRYDYYKDRPTVLQKGNVFIGGSFAGLEIVKVKQARNNGHTFNVNPNVGFLLTNKLLIGTEFRYFKNKAGLGDFETTELGITGFAKYYLTSNLNRGILFVEFGGGVNKRKGRFLDNRQTVNFEDPFLPIYFGNIGIDFFFTPKAAVSSKIGFERDMLNETFTLKQGVMDVSLQFFLGK